MCQEIDGVNSPTIHLTASEFQTGLRKSFDECEQRLLRGARDKSFRICSVATVIRRSASSLSSRACSTLAGQPRLRYIPCPRRLGESDLIVASENRMVRLILFILPKACVVA